MKVDDGGLRGPRARHRTRELNDASADRVHAVREYRVKGLAHGLGRAGGSRCEHRENHATRPYARGESHRSWCEASGGPGAVVGTLPGAGYARLTPAGVEYPGPRVVMTIYKVCTANEWAEAVAAGAEAAGGVAFEESLSHPASPTPMTRQRAETPPLTRPM